MHHPGPYSVRPDSHSMELVSPRVTSENHGTAAQGGHPFQSNRAVSGGTEMSEVGLRKADGGDVNMVVDPSHGGDMLPYRYELVFPILSPPQVSSSDKAIEC